MVISHPYLSDLLTYRILFATLDSATLLAYAFTNHNEFYGSKKQKDKNSTKDKKIKKITQIIE